VPTEIDTVFRKQLIHGYVHDPGAAMLGGVSGHAGLFSNGLDLAILMQMMLQHGTYAGRRYLDSSTIAEFTRTQFSANNNRRALGFDKPVRGSKGTGPTCPEASAGSFGHTGFTGTMAWVDPANGLIYIFLSNRVYPDANDNKLLKLNLRTDIQKALYKAAENGTTSYR
jgi:CubicO group peptidase (beta-lactamase class C family)